jgi:3-hydroxyacyl-CoA dehydrogenase/enoyl-CoA hydratase/3-hydroxybutyryl-CoA epimerase
MNTVETRRQVTFTRKDNGIAFLLMDAAGKLNYLNSSGNEELSQAFITAQNDPAIKAVVIISAKPDHFLMGADLVEIRKCGTKEEILKLSRDGQAALNIMAACTKPMVIAINGACLGGGLELALAGHWRIATSDGNTQFALPETRLGLIPGLGGTQRLPRLVGLKQALGMTLSAEPIGTEEALSIGLIDEVVTSDQLMTAAEKRALALAADPSPVKDRIETWTKSSGSSEPGVKATAFCLKDVDEEKANKLFAMTERSIRIKTRGNYPAQTTAIEVMKKGIAQGIKVGLEAESEAFANLAVGDVSANLIALFFSTEFAKQSAASLATKFSEENTERIGIVGSGTMGASLAALAATHGMQVTVRVNPGKEAEAQTRVPEAVKCTSDWSQLADCQIVVEAVSEEMTTKHQVLEQIEAVVTPECTIASNTSSLSLDEVAANMKKQDRFVGLHFFHPVDKMPLVEVVALKTTARKSLGRAADVVLHLEKIPAMVKNGPGFLINRLLTVYILESGYALHDGIPPNWMDEAAVQFGMPIGPWELIDEVGIDVSFITAESLHKAFGNRMKPPEVMHEFWKMGASGKKVGRGVWLWDESGKRKGINPELIQIPYIGHSDEKCPDDVREQLAKRFIYPMIDEAARCLEDKIVMKPREIDMAVIHGMGFPPFRGGLLKYADSVGLKDVADTLRGLYGKDGRTRSVSPLIEKYIAEGRDFYSSRAGKEDE